MQGKQRAFWMGAVLLWAVPCPAASQPAPTAGGPLPSEPQADPAAPLVEPAVSEPAAELLSDAASPDPAAKASPAVATRPIEQAIVLDPGATCLDRERFVRRVARWLERDAVDARIRVVVRGGSSPTDVSFRVDFPAQPAERATEREIEDAPEDCDQLHAAVALSVALAIDAALPDGAPADFDLPDDEELVGPPEPDYLRFALGAFASASHGVLTDVAIGGALRLELGLIPWLDLRLGGFASLLDGERVETAPGTFDSRVFAGRLDACAVGAVVADLRLLGCAGGLVGVFQTRGSGFSEAYADDAIWSALAVGFEFQIRLARWIQLGVSVDLMLPLSRRTIQVEVMNGDPFTRRVATSGAVVGAGPIFQFF